MIIGIIGNRVGWSYNVVAKFLKDNNVYKSDLLVSGGAVGVDFFAQRFAKEIGAAILIIHPDPGMLSPDRYYERNKKIVAKCDIIVAFNKKKGGSGTQYTIDRAIEAGVPVFIFDGKKMVCGDDV